MLSDGLQTLSWEMPFLSMCPWFHKEGMTTYVIFEIRVVRMGPFLLQPEVYLFTHLLCICFFFLLVGNFCLYLLILSVAKQAEGGAPVCG